MTVSAHSTAAVRIAEKSISPEGILTKEEILAHIRRYEERFAMSSKEFMRRKRSGTADDTFETMHWMGLLLHLSGEFYFHED